MLAGYFHDFFGPWDGACEQFLGFQQSTHEHIAVIQCMACDCAQEDQYTKIIAKKIVALSPDIVLTTKNTSRSAWVRLVVLHALTSMRPFHFII
jgi:hypothetical protein